MRVTRRETNVKCSDQIAAIDRPPRAAATDVHSRRALTRPSLLRRRIAENLFHEFEQLGVDVLIADMPTYNGKDRKDVLIRQIREAITEENRKDIIDRLWKGRQERVRRGLFPGGNVPYGFRRNGKGLEVDPTEAEIVRSIFAMAGSGETAPAIALMLSSKELKRRNGKAWTQRQVAAVLVRRPIYAEGVFRYGAVEGRAAELVLLRRSESQPV